MDLSVLRNKSALALGGLLALTVGAGSIQATTLLSTSATAANVAAMAVIGVTCNTLTGPPGSGQTITIHAVPAPLLTNTITVGIVQTPGIKVTAPAIMTLSATGAVAGTVSNTTGIVLTVNSTAGCSNASGIVANTLVAGPNTIAVVLTAQTNAGAVNTDNGLNVTDTITAASSPLVAAAVTVTCGYVAGPTYVPGAPKTISVSSAANLGTPFSVIPGTVSLGVITPAALPSWLVVSPVSVAGTAGTTSVNFSVQAATGTTAANGCGLFAGITQTYLLPLSNAPAPAVTVLVTLVATTLSPLTVTPVPAAPTISMSYTKLSGVATTTTVNVTSSISTLSASTFYQAINFPIWLTVNNATGFIPITSGKNLTFSTTTATDSLAPGTYTATVFLQVANYADEPVTITLLVANKAPTLSVTSANPLPVLYTLGGNTPVSTITIASSDSPIPYTISFGGLLAPQLTANEQLTGIAYSFGTSVGITYNPLLFETSAPGTVISGTVTFTWGSSTPATVTVVTINLTVGSPGAILTSIYPASLPTAAPGTVFSITLTGSGFVGGTDPTLATKVGTVTGSNPATVNQDPNFHLTWINPSNMTLQVTVPALNSGANGDGNLPFLVGGVGGPVYLGVVNGSSTTPTGTAILTIGANPIIYGATSSSSFTEVSGGALPSFAPYDMISIFGSNFCASQITFPAVAPAAAYTNGGCTSTTILAGKPDPIYNVFPFSLTPDSLILPAPPLSTLWRNLTVTLYPHGTLSGGLNAPLLFATNGQINAIVPGAATAAAEYDIIVTFGPSTALAVSAPFPVNIVATDPGIFTIGSDGQGPAAALQNQTYALLSSANPAGMRSGAANSDTIQLFVTGLGVPPSPTSSTCAPALTGAGNYLTALNASTTPNGAYLTIDGAVIEDTLLGADLPPCLYALTYGTQPTATVGGQSAVVSYAAFVGNTVAGLYQMNIQLPSTTAAGDLQPNFPASTTGEVVTLLAPMQLPIYVTVGGHTSQAGVYLSVAPRLQMAAPTSLSLEQLQNWTTGNAVIASLGTTTYSYALTAGVLPAGLTLVTSSGLITGTVAANTAGSYLVTVTATDSAALPLTGSVTFTITVGGGLYVSYSGTPNVTNVFGTAGVSLPDITAIGGSGSGYTYALTSSTLASPPAGMSLTSSSIGQLVVSSAAEGGIYLLSVTAADGSTPAITGVDTFTYTVNLHMAYVVTTSTPPAAGTTAVGTLTTTGFTTGVHYTSNNPAFTIVDGTGVVSITGLSDGAVTAIITATDTGTAAGAEAGTHATQTFSVSITVTG